MASEVRRTFEHLGKPDANIRVCMDPLFEGVAEAPKWERIKLSGKLRHNVVTLRGNLNANGRPLLPVARWSKASNE